MKELSNIPINISGMELLDVKEFEKTEITRLVNTTINKLTKIIEIQEFSLHIKPYHDKGKQVKYSINTKLSTNEGLFTTKKWGWDIIDVCSNVLKDLERVVIKHKKRDENILIRRHRDTKNLKKGK